MGADSALKKLYIALHVTDVEAIAVGWSDSLIPRRISVGMFVIWRGVYGEFVVGGSDTAAWEEVGT
jgi:hypothetical protein